MKEIGQVLKEAREKNGVSIEEAAEDLNLRVSQINSIEAGELKAFKDVYYLKFFVRDYAKYLGLDSEKILDDFNEFIFDYTSRIPTNKIQRGRKIREAKKIASPYTVSKEKLMSPLLFYSFVIIMVILIVYLLIGILARDNFKQEKSNSKYLGVEYYEFSK